jgi:hypothetical protein
MLAAQLEHGVECVLPREDGPGDDDHVAIPIIRSPDETKRNPESDREFSPGLRYAPSGLHAIRQPVTW